MQKFLLIVSVLVLASLASVVEDKNMLELWEAWKSTHDKTYTPDEEQSRLHVFINNHKTIREKNAAHPLTKFSLNKFSDLTAEEFKNARVKSSPVDDDMVAINTETADQTGAQDPPASIDWRTKNVITPIKDQGNCGASYTFAAAAALESFYAISGSPLTSFSEQQMIDCYQNYQVAEGCNGGLIDFALGYAINSGIQPEDSYPYTAEQDTCKYDESKAIKIPAYSKLVGSLSVSNLKSELINQPVTTVLLYGDGDLQHYSSGVLTSCGGYTDQGVMVVGYDVIDGQEAWIIKNSWGTDWGVDGYIYISTDPIPNFNWGVCSLLGNPRVLVKSN